MRKYLSIIVILCLLPLIPSRWVSAKVAKVIVENNSKQSREIIIGIDRWDDQFWKIIGNVKPGEQVEYEVSQDVDKIVNIKWQGKKGTPVLIKKGEEKTFIITSEDLQEKKETPHTSMFDSDHLLW